MWLLFRCNRTSEWKPHSGWNGMDGESWKLPKARSRKMGAAFGNRPSQVRELAQKKVVF